MAVTVKKSCILTCPHCDIASREEMPIDFCQYYYECKKCGALLKPVPGDCCVYCSFGDTPCPPRQAYADCCSSD